MKLESVYSKRIYELISQWRFVKSKEFKITWLKKILFLDSGSNKKASYLKNSTKFRQNVLEKAKKELNEKTSIQLNYTLRKTGRTYTHVRFSYHFPEETALGEKGDVAKREENPLSKDPVYVRMVEKFYASPELATKALRIIDRKRLNRVLYDIDVLHVDRKIDNLKSYTEKALRNEINQKAEISGTRGEGRG